MKFVTGFYLDNLTYYCIVVGYCLVCILITYLNTVLLVIMISADPFTERKLFLNVPSSASSVSGLGRYSITNNIQKRVNTAFKFSYKRLSLWPLALNTTTNIAVNILAPSNYSNGHGGILNLKSRANSFHRLTTLIRQRASLIRHIQHSNGSKFLMSLGVSYLLRGACMVPLFVTITFFGNDFNPYIRCNYYIAVTFFNNLTGYCCAYSQLGIAIDRFRAIVTPFKKGFTQYQTQIAIGLIWLCSILAATPSIVLLQTRKTEHVFNHQSRMFCQFTKFENLLMISLQISIGCGFPVLTCCVLYSIIIIRLWSGGKTKTGLKNPSASSPILNKMMENESNLFIKNFSVKMANHQTKWRFKQVKNRKLLNGARFSLTPSLLEHHKQPTNLHGENNIKYDDMSTTTAIVKETDLDEECNSNKDAWNKQIKQSILSDTTNKIPLKQHPSGHKNGIDGFKKLRASINQKGDNNITTQKSPLVVQLKSPTKPDTINSSYTMENYKHHRQSQSQQQADSKRKKVLSSSSLKRNQRAIKMVVIILILYTICSIPFYVMTILEIAFQEIKISFIVEHVHNMLIMTDHWLHVAVYLYFNSSFRQAFRRIFIEPFVKCGIAIIPPTLLQSRFCLCLQGMSCCSLLGYNPTNLEREPTVMFNSGVHKASVVRRETMSTRVVVNENSQNQNNSLLDNQDDMDNNHMKTITIVNRNDNNANMVTKEDKKRLLIKPGQENVIFTNIGASFSSEKESGKTMLSPDFTLSITKKFHLQCDTTPQDL